MKIMRRGSRRPESLLSVVSLLMMLLSGTSRTWAAGNDPCSVASSVSDVRLVLALKEDRAIFKEGEIIPLALSFTASKKNRYWADVRNYDRSGRLDIESYCVEPEAPDPLESYFKFGVFLGGGIGNIRALDMTPFTAEAELNEWRSLGPGHYKVYAISHRVWRMPDPNEKTPYGHVAEVVRSNGVEFDVVPAPREWQNEQIRAAMKTLTGTSTPEEAIRAARSLRFLNTEESTKQLARLFWGLNQQPGGWDLMFGLFGSPYRQVAIDSMRGDFPVPDHAITNEFLTTLVNLQVSRDPRWDPSSVDSTKPEAGEEYWQRRQEHFRELIKAEVHEVLAALPQKTARARALTLEGVLMASGDDPALVQALRPDLVAVWGDLPAEIQRELIQFRWPIIADSEMLPILRQIVAQPPPPVRTEDAMMRDAALQHIYEINPQVGREAILRDLQDVRAQPSLDVIKLLQPEDLAAAVNPAIERMNRHNERELDFVLVDRYADSGALGRVQTVFEERVGKWACAPESGMLRFFLRVAPEYGAKEVAASLKARKDTHCYSQLLQSLGDALPKAQDVAIESLSDPDPELVQDAVIALGRWGSGDAETALWSRLQRFHEEWIGHQGELRMTPDYQSPGARGAALEQALVHAIAGGPGWMCSPDKLRKLADLVWTDSQRQQIESWIREWNQGQALIHSGWFPEDNPTFSVLQYEALTEDQLRTKLEQFPRGTKLLWQFWQPGQISPPVSMSKQEEVYERMRAVAEEHGVALGEANHP
jgi:hypothetical protein